MKAICVIFALCLVVVNAGTIVQPTTDYEVMIHGIIHEIGQIVKEAAEALQHQFEQIVLDPVEQVKAVVESIEDLREENVKCVAAEDDKVNATIDNMYKEMAECGIAAAKTSAEIMTDIIFSTQQLVFDGYDIIRGFLKCQKQTNIVLKKACYARLTVRATLYLKNARTSIKTIKESTNERIPAVLVDVGTCTQEAADAAIEELDNIYATISDCIANT